MQELTPPDCGCSSTNEKQVNRTMFCEDKVGLKEAFSKHIWADVENVADEVDHLRLGHVKHVLHNQLVHQVHEVSKTAESKHRSRTEHKYNLSLKKILIFVCVFQFFLMN